MDASIKGLRKHPPSFVTEFDMYQMGLYYPYSSVIMLAQKQQSWSFVHQPVVPLSYLGITNKPNAKFINQTTRPKKSVLLKKDINNNIN